MKVTAKVIKIGPEALSKTDPMVILFDEKATESLEQVAVIQHFEQPKAEQSLALKVSDQIRINDIPYTIQQVGALVATNLTSIGHVTLIFRAPTSEDKMQSAIYLTNEKTPMPTFDLNTTITYQF